MMSPSSPRRFLQRGITLVELMVALLIGIVLVGGVIQVFLGSRESYRLNEASARLQENGRFAIDAISRDLRMGGFPPCFLRGGIVTNLLAGVPPALNLDEPVSGWEAAGTAPGETRPSNPGAALEAVPGSSWGTTAGVTVASLNAVPGADILRVRRNIEFPPNITDISPGAAQTVVTTTQTSDLAVNDIFVMCNGNTGQGFLVQACNVQDIAGGPGITLTNATLSAGCTPGNQMPHDLGGNWGNEGLLTIPREIVFFVGKRDGAAANPPALFRRVDRDGLAGPQAEELVEGIESLQLLFGIDTTGNFTADDYVPADQVPRWDRVVAVRIGLLLVSIENNVVPAGQGSLDVLGTTFQPAANDRRLRQVMTATVALRNRVP
ncbi:MAG: PilW family protein [Gammaproteobacteria bacterium]|nr:PilW family protein [Gammaproteobacteria bacterium]